MRARTGSTDLEWALATIGAGGAALLWAWCAHWSASDLSPGVEGCLTATVAGFVMARLQGLSYARALALIAPVTVTMYVVLAATAGPTLGAGITGLALVTIGLVGLAGAVGDPRAPQQAPRRRRAVAHRAVATHS
jgi:hypothetical protein